MGIFAIVLGQVLEESIADVIGVTGIGPATTGPTALECRQVATCRQILNVSHVVIVLVDLEVRRVTFDEPTIAHYAAVKSLIQVIDFVKHHAIGKTLWALSWNINLD